MSDELEAGGALLTAGLASSTLQDGEARHGGGGSCINCGAALAGKFCASCGQPAHVHRTLGHMFEEALHGVLHFDGRMWRTLPKLILRPGTLTHDHIIGRRARYVSPLAAFLFTIFLMFFVFALVGEQSTNERPQTLAQMAGEVASARQGLTEAEAALAETKASLAGVQAGMNMDSALDALEETVDDAKDSVADAEEAVAEERARIDGLRAALLQLDKNAASPPPVTAATTKGEEVIAARQIIEAALADPLGVTPGISATISAEGEVDVNQSIILSGSEPIFEQIREASANGTLKVNTGNEKLDKKLKAKFENPELAWYKIKNSAYKFSFLLLPISLPFLWLIFAWKKGLTLFDHSVFILYSLTFMSLLFVFMAFIGRGPDWLQGALFPVLGLAPPVHMFFQLKGGYQLGWFSALWRTLVLLVFAFLCLLLFLTAITMLGILG